MCSYSEHFGYHSTTPSTTSVPPSALLQPPRGSQSESPTAYARASTPSGSSCRVPTDPGEETTKDNMILQEDRSHSNGGALDSGGVVGGGDDGDGDGGGDDGGAVLGESDDAVMAG